jgi:phosphoribosyl-ATP pyrophosphohydrolase
MAKKEVLKKPLRRKAVPNSATQPQVPAAAADAEGGNETVAPLPGELAATVLDRLYAVVLSRKGGDPAVSHSARLLGRGREKVAQKFGEEAVECLIEAVAGNRQALVAESADVLYHLIVLWVDAGISAAEVWYELHRREGISGIVEKASRVRELPTAFGLRTSKIP